MLAACWLCVWLCVLPTALTMLTVRAGNDACCMDKCLNDCSGTDRGVCVPFGTTGTDDNGDYVNGVKHHVFQCKCNTGYTGADCSTRATCLTDAFNLDVCSAMGMANAPGTAKDECKISKLESGHLYTAHKNPDCGISHADGTGVDKCISNSDAINVFNKALGKSYSSVTDIVDSENGNAKMVGTVITTKEKGCCNSGKLRLVDNKATNSDCYDHFWTFQCVPDCATVCCIKPTTTTQTTVTQTTVTTVTTTTATVRPALSPCRRAVAVLGSAPDRHDCCVNVCLFVTIGL